MMVMSYVVCQMEYLENSNEAVENLAYVEVYMYV